MAAGAPPPALPHPAVVDLSYRLAGNATLIGASANIVTATLAERAGNHITFFKWMKTGVPVTVVRRQPLAAPPIEVSALCVLQLKPALLPPLGMQVSVAMADIWMILRFCL